MEILDIPSPLQINWYDVVDSGVIATQPPQVNNPLYPGDTNNYYQDAYNLWNSKEPLKIWVWVAKPKNATITFDTATLTSTVDNVYTLTVPNPDGKIFSMNIDGSSKTFSIWYFWNTSLAYSTLVSQMNTWLWVYYSVSYISWTSIQITKFDKSTLSFSPANLTKSIVLNTFTTNSLIQFTIDGTAIFINGNTYGWSAQTALNYLDTQLPLNTYYTIVSWSTMIISRIDSTVVTITQNSTYYKYDLVYNSYYMWVSQLWDNATVTVDGVAYYMDWTKTWYFKWDRILRNLQWLYTSVDSNTAMVNWWGITWQYWVRFYSKNTQNLIKVTRPAWCTATRAILKNDAWTQLVTANYSWDDATFNYQLSWNTFYKIYADSNGATYTTYSGTNWWNLDNINYDNTIWTNNILSISTEAKLTSFWLKVITWAYDNGTTFDATWLLANDANYYNTSPVRKHKLHINNSDFSPITITSNVNYLWWYSSDWGNWFSFSNLNTVVATIGLYTEIAITLWLTANNYFVLVWFDPKKIVLTANWWGGNSNGTWENQSQSCNSKYLSTTVLTTWKIFLTDAGNYGNIVDIKRWGFTINITTNASVKCTCICT